MTVPVRRCLMIALLLFVPSRAAAQPGSDDDDGTRSTPPASAAPPAVSSNATDRGPTDWTAKRTINVSTADYVITSAGAAGALVSALLTPFPKHARGGVLLDEDA